MSVTGAGIGIIVEREGKLLLGKRRKDLRSSRIPGDGLWTFPGGEIEFGETFPQAAKRELYEETGIKGQSFEFFCVNNDIGGEAHWVTIGAKCTEYVGDPRVLEPDKISQWEYFSTDNLPPLHGPTANIVESYLTGRAYNPE